MPPPGRYNISNLLAVAAVLHDAGMTHAEVEIDRAAAIRRAYV